MGRPRAFTDVESLQAGIDEYIAAALLEARPLTVAGLAVHLEVDRMTLFEYKRGTYDLESEKYSDTIKKAITYIEANKLEKALKGDYTPAVAIFDLKNNHGYKDKREVESSGSLDIGNTPITQLKDEEIEQEIIRRRQAGEG